MSSSKRMTSADVKNNVETLKPAISRPESEDSWESIARAMAQLSAIVSQAATDHPLEIVGAAQTVYRSINSAMNSERTRLSGAALDLVTVLASELGSRHFEVLLALFMPTLLGLCARTNKVIIARARKCVYSIIETTQLSAILGFLSHHVDSKSPSLRLTTIDGVLKCLNCLNPPDLEKDARAMDIETVIKATARDATAEIRQSSRKAFEAYKLILPNRVERFAAPLSPTTKKYLDIQTKAVPNNEPIRPRTRTISTKSVKAQLSSSTSAMRSQTSTTSTTRPPTHTRSASSTIPAGITAGPSGNHVDKDIVPVRKERVLTRMDPPQVPVKRPVPAPERNIPRSNSALDTRSKTTEFSSARSGSVDASKRVRPSPSVPSFTPASGSSGGPSRVLNPAVTEVKSTTEGTSSNKVGGARRVPVVVPAVPIKEPPARIPSNSSMATAFKVATTSTKSTGSARQATATEKTRPVPTKPAVPNVKPATVNERPKFKPVSSKIGPPTTTTAMPEKPTVKKTQSVPNFDNTVAAKPSSNLAKSTVTRPTASSIAAAAASKPALSRSTTEKKVVPAKPVWGGLSGRAKPAATARSQSSVPSKAAAQRAAPTRTVSIAMAIPLPLSPAQEPAIIIDNLDDEEGALILDATVPVPAQVEVESPEDVQEDIVQLDDQNPAESLAETSADSQNPAEETQSEVLESNEEEKNDILESNKETQNEVLESTEEESADEGLHVLITESTPARISPSPDILRTPPAVRTDLLLSTNDENIAVGTGNIFDSPNKTPISSLLSSIERGFLFTPSSPMSPPESYAGVPNPLQGTGFNMQNIPFSLYAKGVVSPNE